MNRETLFTLLQLSGGTLPTGAFSQSWGLETYVSDGRVRDVNSLEEFLTSYMRAVLATLEGPAFCRGYDLAAEGGLVGNQALGELDDLVTAMRLTRESREASLRTGKALLRIASDMMRDEEVTAYYREKQARGTNMPVAFGALAWVAGISKKEALGAFFFSGVNALVQSGIKLIPLGSGEAQRLLYDLHGKLEETTKLAMETPMEEASSFCPAFDIATTTHETLATRLYMS